MHNPSPASHIIKNKQRLLSNTNRIDAQWVHDFCYEKLNEAPIASVIIASIYSARSYEDIVKKAERVCYKKDQTNVYCIKLKTSWNYRREKKKSISPSLSQNYNQDIGIHLPKFLWHGISQLKGTKDKIEEVANEFLKPLKKKCFHALTQEQIRACLAFNRFKFDISNAELAFISNIDLTDCVNAQYGQMNNDSIQQKLDSYIANFCSAVQPLSCSIVYTEKLFGSYYTPMESQVASLFQPLIRVVERQPTSIAKCRKHFNAVSFYVVLLIQLSTMHRPRAQFNISLDQFDLQINTMMVNDKLGSERILPIPVGLAKIIQRYVQFINEHIKYVQGTRNSQVDILRAALNAELPLIWSYTEKGKLSLVKSHEYSRLLKNRYLKNNWSRHFVSTYLTQKEMNRDLIAKFMGHADETGLHYQFSTNNLEDLREVSDLIQDMLANDLKILTQGFLV